MRTDEGLDEVLWVKGSGLKDGAAICRGDQSDLVKSPEGHDDNQKHPRTRETHKCPGLCGSDVRNRLDETERNGTDEFEEKSVTKTERIGQTEWRIKRNGMDGDGVGYGTDVPMGCRLRKTERTDLGRRKAVEGLRRRQWQALAGPEGTRCGPNGIACCGNMDRWRQDLWKADR